jgi:hypothetical protein
MEAKEFLNQKRIGLVNKFYYQVLEIKKTRYTLVNERGRGF